MKRKGSYASAVGLSYDPGTDTTPLLSVKGDGLDADLIVKFAQRYNIPVVDNPELTQSLNSLEIDQQIPPSLFQAVAIVLAHVDTVLERS